MREDMAWVSENPMVADESVVGRPVNVDGRRGVVVAAHGVAVTVDFEPWIVTAARRALQACGRLLPWRWSTTNKSAAAAPDPGLPPGKPHTQMRGSAPMADPPGRTTMGVDSLGVRLACDHRIEPGTVHQEWVDPDPAIGGFSTRQMVGRCQRCGETVRAW